MLHFDWDGYCLVLGYPTVGPFLTTISDLCHHDQDHDNHSQSCHDKLTSILICQNSPLSTSHALSPTIMLYTFTSSCSHSGVIKPVQKRGGKHEGSWFCRIRGPLVTGVSGIKTVYTSTNPTVESARTRIAFFLRVSPSTVRILHNGVEIPMMTGATSGGSNSPTRTATALSHAVPDGVISSSMAPDRAISQHPLQATPDAARSGNPSTPERVESLSSRGATVTPDAAPSAAPSDPPQLQTNFDRVERSPSSQATCRTCNAKILVGTLRIGKPVYRPAYGNYNIHYHHKSCCSESFLSSLRFQDGLSLQQQLHVQAISKEDRRMKIQERSELWRSLRNFRTQQARTERSALYMVFTNAVIEEIVFKMPSTPAGLLKCNGIGPGKLDKYGETILCIVNEFLKKYGTAAAPQSV